MEKRTGMRGWRKVRTGAAAALLAALTALSAAGCAYAYPPAAGAAPAAGAPAGNQAAAELPDTGAPGQNGDIYILYTSDVHCGIDTGFGYAGLQQVRDSLEAQGYATILVDDGDAVQGEAVGTLSRGATIVGLMNELGYDAAIPGNHEFDYGMDRFLELTKMADYPYISCNLNRKGELLLPPYVVLEAAGTKIGFVGVTTPKTYTSSAPSHFQNEEGEFIYDFMRGGDGQELYDAIQAAVDGARSEGAEYVCVMAHLGLEEICRPWTYADVIANTRGIDIFFDGHSHDTEQVVMKNMDGEDVVRSACGTRLECIGYSHISAEKGIVDTGVWSWPNSVSAPELLSIHNEAADAVAAARTELAGLLDEVVAVSTVEMTIYDPTEKDFTGNPVRIARRMETNLGDFCADAMRFGGGADIGIINGGAIRVDVHKGDVTYGDMINVHPFQNSLCVVEATGQQVLDALEWGAHSFPEEGGPFLQVSGLTYEIDATVPSGCIEDDNGMCIGIEGERRVRSVLVGGVPLDPDATYSVASTDYVLLDHGSGITAFDGAPILQDRVKLDNQTLIEYARETLGGVIGEEYADPYGQGRITYVE